MAQQVEGLVARARFLIPVEPERGVAARIEGGYVLAESGKISEVGAWTEEAERSILARVRSGVLRPLGRAGGPAEPVPLLPGILLPGFVKAHGHDLEPPLIGVAKDESLADWLDHAVGSFARFVAERERELTAGLGVSPCLAACRKARLDDLSYGITTSLSHLCTFGKYRAGEAVAANREAGTRLFLAVGSQDRHYDPAVLDTVEAALRRLDGYVEAFGAEPRVSLMPGPDQFFSNGPELLKAQKAWARSHGTPIHIHSSEEPATTEWFRRAYGMTEVEYGHSIGFLDDRTMLAHQVNTTERDLKLIRDCGAAVVHNPLANAILGSGMPPIREMLAAGIRVAISTDGSGSADNQNMIAAARLAGQYQKAFHRDASLLRSEELLRLVTSAPAAMLGLRAGALRPGFDADFILVDTRLPNLTPTRLDNCVENLLWAANGSEIRYVVVDGRVLVDDYRFTTLPADRVLAAVQELSERFAAWRRTAPEVRAAGRRGQKEQR